MKKIDRQKVISFLEFCVFVVIIVQVFFGVTYLFRNTDYSRRHIVGLKQEKVDMVYVGGSAAFVYWQPLRAWNECGYTSYSYATDTIPAESIKAYIEEARKLQNPELFVVGIRAFQYYSDEPAEQGVRNGTDSMDMTSLSRYKILNEYFRNREIPEDTDVLSYYLDIAKYHTNVGNLGASTAWKLIDNDDNVVNKGWEWIDKYGYLEQPENFHTDERAKLPDNDIRLLKELLTYCKAENLNVLFVVCQYWITKEHQTKYNTMADMIQSYGFQYLNANEYYDEMTLDFSTDFYNKNHVNLFGAKKYTEFLEKYISENYNLENHRGDPAYASWDEAYQEFQKQEEHHAQTVLDLKADVEKSSEIQKQMKEAKSLAEWQKLVSDNRFTLIVTGTQEIRWPENVADQRVLSDWGLTSDSSRYIRVIKGGEIKYTNAKDEALTAEGVLGIWDDTSYHVSVEKEFPVITLNDQQMLTDKTKVNVIIFENNYRKMIGILTLTVNEAGKVEISYN